MSIAGLNFGSSKSSSQGSSLDYGAQQSSTFSDSLARAISAGQSTSTQNVWNADVLQQLYGQALGAAGTANAPLFQGQTADLYGAGSNILDKLGVGAGEDYLSARLTDTSARDEQLGALKTGLGDLFRDELNPAITSHAVATGTLGGGRQGVAQGVAAGKIAQQYQQGAASIYATDQAQRDAAAGSLIAGQNQAAATGLQGLQGQLGFAQAGLSGALTPYSALAQIIGGPAVLTQGQSTESSQSEQVARAISEALGFNYGTSQNTSGTKAFNFGIGI